MLMHDDFVIVRSESFERSVMQTKGPGNRLLMVDGMPRRNNRDPEISTR